MYKNITYYKNYTNIEYKKHSNEHLLNFNGEVVNTIINNLTTKSIPNVPNNKMAYVTYFLTFLNFIPFPPFFPT